MYPERELEANASFPVKQIQYNRSAEETKGERDMPGLPVGGATDLTEFET
jgi:hypothetical protein